MAEEEKIVLTLGEQVKEEVQEVAPEEKAEETKIDAAQASKALSEQLDASYAELSEDEKKVVDDFATKIDITETTSILQYGAAAQTKVADFSENALRNVQSKEKDLGEVGKSLSELVNHLNNFSVNEEEGFFSKLFKKGANNIKNLQTKYSECEVNVEKIVDILEKHQVTLLKDISVLDQLYEKNLVNFKELTMYILSGYKALDKIKKEDLPAALKKAEESGKPEDAQAANDLGNAINRFEKKLHDLELTRVVAIQMGPQIRLVQNNDTAMVEKIQSTLVNTIPLWKSQMLIALGINHSKEALKAQNEVTEMTNRMLKENAQNLKMATIETAKQAERGIVDIETLTETNKKLIETLEEVQKIQTEGREKRMAAQVELRRIETELQSKLTNVKDLAK